MPFETGNTSLLIAAGILASWSVIGWFAMSYLTLRRAERRLAAGAYDELIRDVISSAVPMVVEQVKESAQASMAGVLSGQARRDRSVDRAIGEDLLQANDPVIGELLRQYFPKAYKRMVENPELAQATLERLGPILQQYLPRQLRGGAPGGSPDHW